MHHPTDRIAHTTAFVTLVVEHWLEGEIAQWVHPMKDRSNDPLHHELHLDPENMDKSGAELYRHVNGQKVAVHCSVYREERGTDRLFSQHTVKFIVQTIIFK